MRRASRPGRPCGFAISAPRDRCSTHCRRWSLCSRTFSASATGRYGERKSWPSVASLINQESCSTVPHDPVLDRPFVSRLRCRRGMTQAMPAARYCHDGCDVGKHTIVKIKAQIGCVTGTEIVFLFKRSFRKPPRSGNPSQAEFARRKSTSCLASHSTQQFSL